MLVVGTHTSDSDRVCQLLELTGGQPRVATSVAHALRNIANADMLWLSPSGLDGDRAAEVLLSAWTRRRQGPAVVTVEEFNVGRQFRHLMQGAVFVLQEPVTTALAQRVILECFSQVLLRRQLYDITRDVERLKKVVAFQRAWLIALIVSQVVYFVVTFVQP